MKEASEEKYSTDDLKQKADILMQAEEIRSDKECMAALKPYLKKKAGHINSIAGLKKRYKDLTEGGEKEKEEAEV